MADGTQLNQNTTAGDVIATDDIGGQKHQRVKNEWGPDGTANEVDDVDGKRLPVKAVVAPTTAGGLQKYHAVCAASTNAANIKASPGQVYAVRVFNATDYPFYVKLHNTAGVPSAGAGVVETIGIQAGTQFVHELPPGDEFTVGIGLTIVKGIADNDTTPVALNDGVVDVFYK